MICCLHCGRTFIPGRKTQHYCNAPSCQRKRKSNWQSDKIKNDPDYRAAQKDAQKQWRSTHTDYWKEYRAVNTPYTERNRRLQRERNRKRRHKSNTTIAKMDATPSDLSGTYCILPFTSASKELIAKMDVRVQLFTIQPVTDKKSDCKERTYTAYG